MSFELLGITEAVEVGVVVVDIVAHCHVNICLGEFSWHSDLHTCIGLYVRTIFTVFMHSVQIKKAPLFFLS